MKTCRYCLKAAALLRFRDQGYPYQADYGPVWTCTPCKAWVGCHKGTENALGGLANAELRVAKQAAHAAFDPLWQAKIRRDKCSKNKAHNAGYAWLADQLGIPVKKCHIGYMSLEECQRTVEICLSALKKKESA
ncbi:zinc-finger-containing domain protein [compost metagenome]